MSLLNEVKSHKPNLHGSPVILLFSSDILKFSVHSSVTMYWILGRKPELSLVNKVLLYKTILKRIWTYGVPLWGSTSHSNIEILQRFQNKVLRTMVNAPWYIPNKFLHTEFDVILTVHR